MKPNLEMQQPLKSTLQSVVMSEPTTRVRLQPPEKIPPTFGQCLADKMATKVGSWSFLIGQSVVLAGWVGCNLMPGVPHWDESPFILLNLVFSFASAYTAPVVLMSQNRQSEEDRENANHNYQVTLQAAQNIELLHDKMDAMYTKKLEELSTLIKQQTANEMRVVVLRDPQPNAEPAISMLPVLNSESNEKDFINVIDEKCFQSFLNLNHAKVITSPLESNSVHHA
ncbi:MAG: DUF1003 domain-containing protein [Scytolyngbya sp. HA4215-MV1]|jgi:uncharacterized membrane protein|nr:DUF1003 domain-containing protein [Scytolyngbya sp. HA4215-MV1]